MKINVSGFFCGDKRLCLNGLCVVGKEVLVFRENNVLKHFSRLGIERMGDVLVFAVCRLAARHGDGITVVTFKYFYVVNNKTFVNRNGYDCFEFSDRIADFTNSYIIDLHIGSPCVSSYVFIILSLFSYLCKRFFRNFIKFFSKKYHLRHEKNDFFIKYGMPFLSNRLFGGVYFIGIGGVSMSALANLLADAGVPVRGCDARESFFVRKLRARGIPVTVGEVPEAAISEPVIVYTEAVDRHTTLLEQAQKEGKEVLTRAMLLGEIAQAYPHVLSVAGCHGKTSATAMLAHIFSAAGMPFTCHIGGEDTAFGNYFSTGREYFLTEACEFRRSFLSLKSEIAVVLNTDLDHTDCYASAEDILNAYTRFAAAAQQVVVNAEDANAVRIPHALSFGVHTGDIRATRICANGEQYCFTVSEKGIPVTRIRLRVLGRVQMQNALAAYAAARLAGIPARTIAEGLEDFRGVKRRFEYAGTLNHIPVICDYAHHPAEMRAAIATAEGICRGTVRVVFQPHTYTRTRDLMADFVSVLRRAESPVVYRTYAARETFFWEGSAPALVSRVPEAVYVQSPHDLRRRLLETAQKDDLILVLGAGDIDEIVRGLLDKS